MEGIWFNCITNKIYICYSLVLNILTTPVATELQKINAFLIIGLQRLRQKIIITDFYETHYNSITNT